MRWHARGRAAAVGHQHIGQGPARDRGGERIDLRVQERPAVVSRQEPAVGAEPGVGYAAAQGCCLDAQPVGIADGRGEADEHVQRGAGTPAAARLPGRRGLRLRQAALGEVLLLCHEAVDDAADAADVRVSGGLVSMKHAGPRGGGPVRPSGGGLADLLAGDLREVGGGRARAELGRHRGPCRDCLPVGRHGLRVLGICRCGRVEESRDVPCPLCGGGHGGGGLVACCCCGEVRLLAGEQHAGAGRCCLGRPARGAFQRGRRVPGQRRCLALPQMRARLRPFGELGYPLQRDPGVLFECIVEGLLRVVSFLLGPLGFGLRGRSGPCVPSGGAGQGAELPDLASPRLGACFEPGDKRSRLAEERVDVGVSTWCAPGRQALPRARRPGPGRGRAWRNWWTGCARSRRCRGR